MANGQISGTQFAQLLVTQLPVFDKLILEDIRPEDGWIGTVETGVFPSNSGVTHTLDRFNHVFPNVTKAWSAVGATSCVGTPCDKTENYLTWGATRITYSLLEQYWASQLLCFDQQMHVTHAKEHFRQIISSILKPATSAIQSNFLRKYGAINAGKKWAASTAMSDFTFEFVSVGGEEIYIDATVLPSSKLTPQMLQRRVQPLMQVGYFGRNPFKDQPPLIELVTDLDTCWDLDRLATAGTSPTVAANWR